MAFTPFLGYIPLGFTRATIIHIPVIIGSLMLGPKKERRLGFVFGLTSFINNTINPSVTSFVFTPFYSLGEYSGGIGSLIICFCTADTLWESYRFCLPPRYETDEKQTNGTSVFGTGTRGTLRSADQHTSGHEYDLSVLRGQLCGSKAGLRQMRVYSAITAIITVNGIPEAIVAAVIVALVGKVLMNTKVMKNIGV